MNTPQKSLSFRERSAALAGLDNTVSPFNLFELNKPHERIGTLVYLNVGDVFEKNDIYERGDDIMVIGANSTIRPGTKIDDRIVERNPRRWIAPAH